MERLPIELLAMIASRLNAADLGTFRLVSSKWAAIGAHLIPRNGVSILNTATGLEELQRVLDLGLITDTKLLTIYHGEWPVCDRKQWEVHPLLFGGNNRPSLAYVQDHYALKADQAFQAYASFIQKEQTRRYGNDVQVIHHAFNVLSNLHTVRICAIPNGRLPLKYRKMQKEIWLTPKRQCHIGSVVQAIILGLGDGFANVRELEIHGMFDPTDVQLAPGRRLPYIQRLNIASLWSRSTTRSFLEAFPNLVHLSLRFEGWGPSIPNVIGSLFWQNLKTLYLEEIWASEQDLLRLFQRHQSSLEEFSLNNAALTQGSWKSLFSSMRTNNNSTRIVAKGELYGRRGRDTLILNNTAARLLAKYFQDKKVAWPFNKVPDGDA